MYKRRLATENAELRAELERQWAYNHSERCEHGWPHSGRCFWPKPDLLEATEGRSLNLRRRKLRWPTLKRDPDSL